MDHKAVALQLFEFVREPGLGKAQVVSHKKISVVMPLLESGSCFLVMTASCLQKAAASKQKQHVARKKGSCSCQGGLEPFS